MISCLIFIVSMWPCAAIIFAPAHYVCVCEYASGPMIYDTCSDFMSIYEGNYEICPKYPFIVPSYASG